MWRILIIAGFVDDPRCLAYELFGSPAVPNKGDAIDLPMSGRHEPVHVTHFVSQRYFLPTEIVVLISLENNFTADQIEGMLSVGWVVRTAEE